MVVGCGVDKGPSAWGSGLSMGRLHAPGVRVLARGMSLEGGAWVLTLSLMSVLVTMTQPMPQHPHWSSLHMPVTCFKREAGSSWDGRVLGGRVRVEVGPACRQGHAFRICSAGPLRGAAGQGEDEASGDDFVHHRSQLRLRGGRGSITSSNEQRGSVESQPAGDAGMHEGFQQRIKVQRDDEGQATVRAGIETREKEEAPFRSQSPRSQDERPRILADEHEQTLRLPDLQLNGRSPSRQSRSESGQQQQEADNGRADGQIRIPRGDEILGSEEMEDERGDGDAQKEVSGDAVVAGGGGGVAPGDFDEVELAAASTSEGGDMLASVRELCLEGKVEDALELFRADLRNISYPLCTNVMHEFADVGRSDLAQAALLHMQMLCVENGESLDTAVYNELMLAYARDEATATEDGLEQAFSVLEMMKRDDVAPDTLTYNRLMEACASAGEACDAWEKGLRVLDLMNEGSVKPVIETFNLLIEACGKCGWSKNTGNGLEKGSQILARMMEDKVNATTDTFNILMYGCAWAAGAGDGWSGVEQGLSFLEAMAEFNAMPDVITFNNLIAACAQAAGSGDGARARDQAFRLLETMRKVGLSPDQGTCDTLIATCAKAAAAGDSEGVDYGLKVLDMMKRAGMTPDEAMHNALLAECVKAAEAIHEEPSRRGWLAVEWMSRALSLMQVGQMDHSPYTGKLVALCTNLVGELSYELTNLAARHRQPSPGGDGGSKSNVEVTAASEDALGAGTGASLRLPASEDGAPMKLEKSWQLQRGAATDSLDYSQPAELFFQLQQLAAKQLQVWTGHSLNPNPLTFHLDPKP